MNPGDVKGNLDWQTEKETANMHLIKDEIYRYLLKQQSPIGLKRLERQLQLPPRERSYLRMILKEMTREGIIRKVENQCYQIVSKHNPRPSHLPPHTIRGLISGVLIKGKGGFHVQSAKQKRSIQVRWPGEMQGKPVAGDRVLILETEKNKGVIVGIKFPGRDRQWGRLKGHWFYPAYGKKRPIHLENETGKGAVVEIQNGTIPRILGRFRETVASADLIACYRNNLYRPWSKPVTVSVPREPELNRRLDLTTLTTFTIDSADTKGLDNALSLEETEAGYVLGIHIPDVSAYVEPDSPLDREARLRGGSVYLPNRTIPMFPEELSERACRLIPGKKRLCISLLFELTPNFEIMGVRFLTSVIQTRFRLHCDSVNQWLGSGKHSDENWTKIIGRKLKILENFSAHRRKLREKRGAVFLNIPGKQLSFNETGHLYALSIGCGGESLKIVEECMILANETVGNLFVKKNIPGIFQVHHQPKPVCLQALNQLKMDSGFLNPESRSFVPPIPQSTVLPLIQGRALRFIGKAFYNRERGHHFALATENYLHFTSPTHRFIDLVAQRMLKAWLNREPAPYSRPQLSAITELVNFRTDLAFRGELEISETLILDRLRQEEKKFFSGIVSSFGKNRLFVELTDWPVHGFIPLSSLPGNFRMSQSGFSRRDNSDRTVRIGTSLRVRIVKIDPLLRILQLAIIDKYQQL